MGTQTILDMASFTANTGKLIQQAFEEFHEKNPQVYALFKKEVFRAIKAGKKKLSAKYIINRLRWDYQFVTEEKTLFTDYEKQTHKFKINDAYTSRYGRKFVQENPEFEDIFNFTRIRSV